MILCFKRCKQKNTEPAPISVAGSVFFMIKLKAYPSIWIISQGATL
jgi:hypothetical protein